MPDNMKAFNQSAGIVFTTLHASFPQPTYIPVAALLPDELDQDGVTWDGMEFGSDTVIWLRKAGYLDFDAVFDDGFNGVVLTEKGLAVLNAIPAIIDTRKSFGEEIEDAVKKGALDKVQQLVPAIIECGATFAFTATKAALT